MLMPHGMFSYVKFDLCKGRSYCKNALFLVLLCTTFFKMLQIVLSTEKRGEMIMSGHKIIHKASLLIEYCYK